MAGWQQRGMVVWKSLEGPLGEGSADVGVGGLSWAGSSVRRAQEQRAKGWRSQVGEYICHRGQLIAGLHWEKHLWL
jgi:hypothetical protein